MNSMIFGKTWDAIKLMQQKAYITPTVDLTVSGKPEATMVYTTKH